MIVWMNYSHGYEARFGHEGRPFARVRRLTAPGPARWQLDWLYGPSARPMVQGATARWLQRQVEAYASRRVGFITAQMPPDPLACPLSAAELDDAFWPGFGRSHAGQPPSKGRYDLGV